jgi:hypothetical protein
VELFKKIQFDKLRSAKAVTAQSSVTHFSTVMTSGGCA